jgi:hypothetical protein
MQDNRERVLPRNQIPITIWQEEILKLPKDLADQYRAELEKRSLYELSLEFSRSIIGGKTQEETNIHFAQRFANSAGRLIYAICSPCGEFDDVSDAMLSIFSTGHIALLDIPCGTGALSLGLLSLLIELRMSFILPKLPLTITICGGDFSDPSRNIFEAMIARISPIADSVGITVKASSFSWDATDDRDTAAMLDYWLKNTQDASDHVVAVLNFSGEMHKKENFEKFEPCIRQILGKLYQKQGAALWMEPKTQESTNNLTKNIFAMLSRVPYLGEWFKVQPGGESRVASFQLQHPFIDEKKIPSGIFLPMFCEYLPEAKYVD